MARFRIAYINATKDLTGGFGDGWVITSKSETYDGSLDEAIAMAQAKLNALSDTNDGHANHTLAIGIFEKRIRKVLGFIPVPNEQCIWNGSKVSKGALPVRVTT